MDAPHEPPSSWVRAPDASRGSDTVVVVIGGRIDRDEVVALGERVRELLAGRGASLLICNVGLLADADAAAVDAVCRIKLVAGRLGCRLLLRDASPRLVELLDLVGLCDVVPARAPQASG